MKKIILFSLAFILMGSYGGIIESAHAQSLSPSAATELNQQLQSAKIELLNLQTQVGMGAPASAGQMALSARDLASLQGALAALSTTLLQIEQVAVAQKGFLTPQQKTVVVPALGNISANLANIASAISQRASQPNNVAQVTVNTPQIMAAQNAHGVVAGAPPTPVTLSESQVAIISSHMPMSRKVEIGLGILMLMAIVALAWPRHKEKKSNAQPTRKTTSPAVAPIAAAVNASASASPINPPSGNPAMKSVMINAQQKSMSGSNQKPA